MDSKKQAISNRINDREMITKEDVILFSPKMIILMI